MFRTESATTAITTSTAVRLAQGATLHWQPRSALRVEIVSGRAWITWEGEPDDHFLDAGACIDLPARRSAWIGAETALTLSAAHSPRRQAPAIGASPEGRSAVGHGLRHALTAVRQRLFGLPVQRRGRPIATP